MEIFRDRGNGLEALGEPPQEAVPVIEIMLVILAFLSERLTGFKWHIDVNISDPRRPARKKIELGATFDNEPDFTGDTVGLMLYSWDYNRADIVRDFFASVVDGHARTLLDQAAFMSVFLQTMKPAMVMMHFDSNFVRDGEGNDVVEDTNGILIITDEAKLGQTIDTRQDLNLSCVEDTFTRTVMKLLDEKLGREEDAYV
jgi:hypothetical protein